MDGTEGTHGAVERNPAEATAREANVSRYVVVKALEDGVTIMGLTRGRDTRSHHSERLDSGEVMIAQFTDLTAAIKIRGRAEIYTDVGRVDSD
jgi:transcription attenuation protein (tryptophan RNA-binding attenuator protein)